MSFPDRFAILLDGEFVKKTLQKRNREFPTVEQVMNEVERIRAHEDLVPLSLYRIFYYTADPLAGLTAHPLSGEAMDFGATPVHSRNTQLINLIENQPNVAVRRGTLAHQGWQLGGSAVKALMNGTKQSVESGDVIPKIQQKGVDMRIGLDIASLALKRLVSTLVLVTGDSDLVPAMKLARREGIRVFLDPLGSVQLRPEIKIHSDRMLG